MLALGGRNDRSVADQGVVNTRVRNEVGLELVQIDVEGAIKSKRRGDGADDLGNQTIEMLVRWSGDIQIAAADVVHGLVVDEESAVRVLNGAVSRQNGVVRLDNSIRNTGSRVDSKLELGLLAVLGSKTLQNESTKAGTGTTTEGVEDKEALKRVTIV